MFSFQQGDELVSEIPTISFSDQRDIGYDPLVDLPDVPMAGATDPATNAGEKAREDGVGYSDPKKMLHREIQRQRRKEMAGLYGRLRSLLPLEFIKGNRAISDHMLQSVKYIEHMKNNIQKLSDQRDKLRGHNGRREYVGSSTNRYCNTVAVGSCWCGVEVTINSEPMEQGFCISRVLKVLLQEGLTVISCISTKANGRLLHTIQSEVPEHMRVDLSSLRQKLTAVVHS